MVCRGGLWKVPWYAVEGFAACGATAMPRHVTKKEHNVVFSRGVHGVAILFQWAAMVSPRASVIAIAAHDWQLTAWRWSCYEISWQCHSNPRQRDGNTKNGDGMAMALASCLHVLAVGGHAAAMDYYDIATAAPRYPSAMPWLNDGPTWTP